MLILIFTLLVQDVLLSPSPKGLTKTFYEVIVGTTTKAFGFDYVDIFYDDAESVIEERKKKETEGGEDYGDEY